MASFRILAYFLRLPINRGRMVGIRTVLFVILGLFGVAYAIRWVQLSRADGKTPATSPVHLAVGFVTNFFDTLGIGSFAPTTALYKLRSLVADERIPGTLHVGHTPPVVVQAFIFIAIIEVDMVTLATMIGAAVVGAWLGAGIVAQWPRRRIQIGMGIALLAAAASFVMANLGLFPIGGVANGLAGGALVIAAGANFVLGALMTVGIGMYAPSMIIISLLGMNPTTAFPVMMGSSAFLMPVASFRFLAARRYAFRAAIGLAVGGIPAVLIAAFIVKALPLEAVRWLVVVVVLYSAVSMLYSAYQEAAVPQPAPEAG